jgi:DNA-binding LytR/AlgR family response regulator
MKALLVDDEPLLTAHLKTQLEKLWPELAIIGTASSGREALDCIASSRPDVVFLDIHMPGMTGLQVASEIPSDIRIVFVTAFDQHAVDAFQKAAVDYLLKPVSEERLKLTIERLKVSHGPRAEVFQIIEQLNQKPISYLEWLKTSKGETTELIAVADVIYFKSSRKYTEVFTKNRTYLIRQSIRELEPVLAPNQFWRIHRGVLLRVEQIMSATKEFGGRYRIRLKDREEELTCSKTYAHLFRQS